MTRQWTAIVEREGDGCVALCPELDISDQGLTLPEPRGNLREDLELFFETASARGIQQRLSGEVNRE